MAKRGIQDSLDNRFSQTNLNRKKEIVPPEGDKYAFSIPFPRNHKEILERHFKQNGLTFSAGVRQILYKYMRENEVGLEREETRERL